MIWEEKVMQNTLNCYDSTLQHTHTHTWWKISFKERNAIRFALYASKKVLIITVWFIAKNIKSFVSYHIEDGSSTVYGRLVSFN